MLILHLLKIAKNKDSTSNAASDMEYPIVYMR